MKKMNDELGAPPSNSQAQRWRSDDWGSLDVQRMNSSLSQSNVELLCVSDGYNAETLQ